MRFGTTLLTKIKTSEKYHKLEMKTVSSWKENKHRKKTTEKQYSFPHSLDNTAHLRNQKPCQIKVSSSTVRKISRSS